MRVVITGGTGPIGRLLVRDLTGHGHEVTILSRNPDRHQATLPSGVFIRRWDPQTMGDWVESIDGTDVVVNLAGEGIAGSRFIPDRWTAKKKRRILESRLKAGSAIVQAIEAATKKPGLLVQASAVGYYGPKESEVNLESSPAAGDFLATVCVQWEAVTEAVESLGLRRVIVRTGLVLSAESGPLPRLILPFKLLTGGYFGSGRQYYSWIHIEDEIRALRFLIENETARGAFNLTAPKPVTAKDFGRALGRVLSRPFYLPIPGFAMRLALGEVATVVLDGQRAVPRKLEELGFAFRFNEIEEALADLLL